MKHFITHLTTAMIHSFCLLCLFLATASVVRCSTGAPAFLRLLLTL